MSKFLPCKLKRVECLRRRNSSYNFYEGEWFLFAQSRFAGSQVPDRKLDTGQGQHDKLYTFEKRTYKVHYNAFMN